MTIFYRCVAVLGIVLWASLSFAQSRSADAIDSNAWEALADRAEAAIDAGRASDDSLEQLRTQIAAYRERFGDARDENAARIRTLQSQLDALGPAPEDGATESETIAATRSDLNQRLEELRAPSVVAEAAYNEANGLVSEIDTMLRARQTKALLTRGPIPVNPSLWPQATRDLMGFFTGLVDETNQVLAKDYNRTRIAESGPIALLLTIVGLFFILRGRHLAGRVVEYFRSFGGSGSGFWTFVISLGRIFIPLVGVYMITRAVQVLGLTGTRGTAVMDAIPHWAAILLGIGWLGERIFDARESDGFAGFAVGNRAELRLTVWFLALMLVLNDAASLIIGAERLDISSASVIRFPIIILTGLVLYRVVRGVRDEPEADPDAAPEEDGVAGTIKGSLFRVMPIIRTVSRLIAVGAPLAAAAGYMNAANATIFPMVWTLALFGLAAVLQRVLSGLYGWAAGKTSEDAIDSLFSALTGFILAIVMLPFIALIWGVRESDLNELWARFLDGVTVGGTRISPVDFLTFLVIFALGYGLTRLLQSALKTSLLPKTKIDTGGQNAIVSGTGYIGLFLAGLVAVTAAGINLSSLAIVAGALSVGIGFGLQTIVSNFVSGIILLIERPVSEGDWIEVAGTMGIVKDISVRATRIETFDRTDVIVPNSDLISGAVTNYTRTPTGRVILTVGVAYGTDTRKVETILREIAEDHPMVVARPAPFIVFQGFGADALEFDIRVIIRDVSWGLAVRTELNHAIAERFAKEGIEIPFAQRDVWLRNPETLARPTAPSTAPLQPPVRELDPGEGADNDGIDDGPSPSQA
ncbi:MAG: mechanosensitive ion channel protein MscS [Rhodobacteraceae bacterium]|nr:mechanosensitive ion channel protein MscS [Paracoccaceae bacterium]QEW21056.1 putative MscS family protein.1 precursor [Marinibacterium anthonyi]